MSKKIFKLCLVKGFTEAYRQLSEEGKKEIWDKIGSFADNSASKMITPYYNCRWSNEQYQTFFIIEYPDIEAVIAETNNNEQADWYRYIIAETILGLDGGSETALP
jgi:hypothetical protein